YLKFVIGIAILHVLEFTGIRHGVTLPDVFVAERCSVAVYSKQLRHRLCAGIATPNKTGIHQPADVFAQKRHADLSGSDRLIRSIQDYLFQVVGRSTWYAVLQNRFYVASIRRFICTIKITWVRAIIIQLLAVLRKCINEDVAVVDKESEDSCI